MGKNQAGILQSQSKEASKGQVSAARCSGQPSLAGKVKRMGIVVGLCPRVVTVCYSFYPDSPSIHSIGPCVGLN